MTAIGMHLSGVIRESGRSLGKGILARTVSRRKLGPEPIANIKLQHIIPATVVTLALLYQQGRELVKPYPNKGLWQRLLAESSIAYLLVNNTKGIYPLAGLGVAAYRAGQQPDVLSVVKSLTSTALVMSMGWLGIHWVSALFSEVPNELEETWMRSLLNEAPMQQWINALKESPLENERQLGQRLTDFEKRLSDMQTAYDKNKLTKEWHVLRDEMKKMAELKDGLLQQLEQEEGTIKQHLKAFTEKVSSPAAKDGFYSFQNVLQTSRKGYVRMTRALNPIFGYIIFGMLLGAPLSRFIGSKLDQHFAQLKQTRARSAFDPKLSLVSSARTNRQPFAGQPALVMPGIGSGTLH